MDKRTPSASLHLKENLQGCIENLAMAPNYANTLIPIFETIMNFIHAFQDRFVAKWAKKGAIQVTGLWNGEGNPHSLAIDDNGISQGDANFVSFRTYNLRQKLKKGERGVGHLTWLKVLERINVMSFIEVGKTIVQRRFDFHLDNEHAFQNYSLGQASTGEELRTFVTLKTLKDGYSIHCPIKLVMIAHRIEAHFLPFLISDDCPDIQVNNQNESLSLRQIIMENTHNPITNKFAIDNVGTFSIKHLLFSKPLAEKGA